MSLSRSLTDSFVAGLILVAPLAVTLYVIRLLAGWSIGLVDPVVRGTRLTRYTANNELVAQVAAAVLIVAAITLLGAVARWNLGRRVFGSLGRVVTVVPLISVVYTSVRQVADSLVDRESAYESVVLVEYPREGVYSIGLVTGESPPATDAVRGGPMYNVFLPNSPNPTGGRLVLVPEEEIHEIDVSVGRGMRLLVTTGIGTDDESPLPRVEGGAD